MAVLSYDYSDLPQDIRVAIYGSGIRGLTVVDAIRKHRKDINISYYLDSFQAGTVQGKEKRVFRDSSSVKDVDLVLIASSYLVAIYNNLVGKGLEKEKIALYSIPNDFFPRQAVVSHKHKFVYVPNTKVAHTSFRHALGEFSENGLEVIDFTQPEYEDYYKFSVVRSPDSRFVSMYNDKIGNEEYCSFFRNIVSGEITFSNVLRAIVSVKHGAGDPHWVPQAYSVWSPNRGLVVDRLFRLERLQESLEALSDDLKIRITLPKLNKSKKKLGVNDISESDRRILHDYYAQDYDVLSYDYA